MQSDRSIRTRSVAPPVAAGADHHAVVITSLSYAPARAASANRCHANRTRAHESAIRQSRRAYRVRCTRLVPARPVPNVQGTMPTGETTLVTREIDRDPRPDMSARGANLALALGAWNKRVGED
jgi:hypothetical protein